MLVAVSEDEDRNLLLVYLSVLLRHDVMEVTCDIGYEEADGEAAAVCGLDPDDDTRGTGLRREGC